MNLPKLEFSFLTGSEKLELMTCEPEKHVVECIADNIKKTRCFHNQNSKEYFEAELKVLTYSRSHGAPKKMKKPHLKK